MSLNKLFQLQKALELNKVAKYNFQIQQKAPVTTSLASTQSNMLSIQLNQFHQSFYYAGRHNQGLFEDFFQWRVLPESHPPS